jgi:glutamate-1-semialdehyde 2,1-aminomutase
MRSRLVRELLGSLVRVPRPLSSFHAEITRRKADDHVASHSDPTNQLFHLISSSVFLGCYALAFFDLTIAMWAGTAALMLRQGGHALLEPPCHDKEQTLLGYDTRTKSMILGSYLVLPVIYLMTMDAWTRPALMEATSAIALQWFLVTMSVVVGRVTYLTPRGATSPGEAPWRSPRRRTAYSRPASRSRSCAPRSPSPRRRPRRPGWSS